MRTSSQGSVSAVSAKCPSVFRACNQAPRLRDSANVVAVPSLRRDEAVARSAAIAVDSYAIELDLTSTGPRFRSQTTIRFRAAPATSTFLDVRADALTAVRLNGVALDPAALHDGRFPLSLPLSPNDIGSSNDIVVDAWMAWSHDGEGLHRHVDQADGRSYAYAMSFLDAAPRWFACFDQPDLKAPVTLTVHCPADWIVAGNGPATRDGAGVWHLAQTPPIATYLATVLAGPYHSRQRTHDGVELVLHARRSLAPHLDRDADALFAHTADCLDEFHRLFGVRYPWGEYHQAFVADFNAGAMENPGCVTFDDAMIFRGAATDAQRDDRANTIAHEMAHMWFGDLVTMRWWDDLWLNESFAEYLGYRVCAAVGMASSWVSFGISRKAWGQLADRRPSTHPVAGNEAADTEQALSEFDGISYAKGAAVLRQLAARLGDEVLLGGLRDHFATHAYGNAEFADLIGSWTQAGAVDLDGWATQWLRTAGMDTLRSEGKVLLRESPASYPAAREHRLAVAACDASGREVSRTEVAVTGLRTALDLPLSAIVLPDPDDRTWATIALPAAAWEAMPGALAALDPLARVAVWNALRLAVTDAALDPRRALDIVLAAIGAEGDEVFARMFDWSLNVLTATYFAADERQAATAGLERVARATLGSTAPGSSQQLAAARAYVSCSSDPGQLRAWLTGAAPVEVDTDLRWQVLRRLSALGELSTLEIDAALRADNSSAGLVEALCCRALRPDPAAKAAAWATLMGDSTVSPSAEPTAAPSNSTLYGLAAGFWHPDQTTLTAPYVARYFAEVSAMAAAHQSGWLAPRLAERTFPWVAVTAQTVALADELLASGQLSPGVHRAVADRTDDLRRAVVSRVRFGA